MDLQRLPPFADMNTLTDKVDRFLERFIALYDNHPVLVSILLSIIWISIYALLYSITR